MRRCKIVDRRSMWKIINYSKEIVLSFNKGNNLSKLTFSLSLITALYWILGNSFNIYLNAFVSAFFEILWLPMLLILFALPILSFIKWYKESFNYKSLYFYSIILSALTFLFIIGKIIKQHWINTKAKRCLFLKRCHLLKGQKIKVKYSFSNIKNKNAS